MVHSDDDRPLYSHTMDVDALVRYVAWLLDDRRLVKDQAFRVFCTQDREEGYVTGETARRWKARQNHTIHIESGWHGEQGLKNIPQ